MELLLTTRLFSLREANALVPLLMATFTEARAVRDGISRVQGNLAARGWPFDPGAPEVSAGAPPAVRGLQEKAVALLNSLTGTLREVAQLGIEVKAADGLCDFRSRLGGRVVYLCWRFGEDAVTHYHELDSGFAGRKPLPAGAEFAGELMH